MDANALLNKLDALDEGLTLIEEKVDGDDKQLQEVRLFDNIYNCYNNFRFISRYL